MTLRLLSHSAQARESESIYNLGKMDGMEVIKMQSNRIGTVTVGLLCLAAIQAGPSWGRGVGLADVEEFLAEARASKAPNVPRMVPAGYNPIAVQCYETADKIFRELGYAVAHNDYAIRLCHRTPSASGPIECFKRAEFLFGPTYPNAHAKMSLKLCAGALFPEAIACHAHADAMFRKMGYAVAHNDLAIELCGSASSAEDPVECFKRAHTMFLNQGYSNAHHKAIQLCSKSNYDAVQEFKERGLAKERMVEERTAEEWIQRLPLEERIRIRMEQHRRYYDSSGPTVILPLPALKPGVGGI